VMGCRSSKPPSDEKFDGIDAACVTPKAASSRSSSRNTTPPKDGVSGVVGQCRVFLKSLGFVAEMSGKVALNAGESIPFIGCFCAVASAAIDKVEKYGDKMDAVRECGELIVDSLDTLTSIANQVDSLEPPDAEKVKKKMEELEKDMKEIENFLDTFGQSGYLKKGVEMVKNGKQMGKLDRKIRMKLKDLVQFYQTATNSKVLDKLDRLQELLLKKPVYSLDEAVADVEARLGEKAKLTNEMLTEIGAKVNLNAEEIDELSVEVHQIHNDTTYIRESMDEQGAQMALIQAKLDAVLKGMQLDPIKSPGMNLEQIKKQKEKEFKADACKEAKEILASFNDDIVEAADGQTRKHLKMKHLVMLAFAEDVNVKGMNKAAMVKRLVEVYPRPKGASYKASTFK